MTTKKKTTKRTTTKTNKTSTKTKAGGAKEPRTTTRSRVLKKIADRMISPADRIVEQVMLRNFNLTVTQALKDMVEEPVRIKRRRSADKILRVIELRLERAAEDARKLASLARSVVNVDSFEGGDGGGPRVQHMADGSIRLAPFEMSGED